MSVLKPDVNASQLSNYCPNKIRSKRGQLLNMNKITSKIILSAIATIAIISLPSTAKAQQNLDNDPLNPTSPTIPNQGSDPYVSVDTIKNLTTENHWFKELPNCYGCPGCAGCDPLW